MIGMVILLLWQMVLVGWTFVMAGHSAREGARQLAVGGDVRMAAESDLPDSFKDDLVLTEGDSFVEVKLRVPMLVPWVGSPLKIDARAGTVVEDDPEPAWRTLPEESPSP
jgi:pilus assembly protein CpaE